jgi:hypothetical protein
MLLHIGGGGWGRHPLAREEDGASHRCCVGEGVAAPRDVAPGGGEMGMSTPELEREMEPPTVVISD